MRVLFYGNGSSGNHGCEAIVRGTVQLLGNMTYTVLSENLDDDIRYGLADISKLIPAKTERARNFSFFKAYTKLKLTGNYTDMDGLYYLPTIQRLRECTDVALSVGGDNYCYGNTELYKYLNSAYRKNHIKTALWGCSIEPDIVKKVDVADDLKQYGLIAARESITYDAARAVECNAILMPDPAFCMKPERCDIDDHVFENEVIGINISPHIMASEHQQGAAYANYKTLIRYILDNTDAYIALISHVVWASNDDRIPLKQLYDDFNHDPRLILVDDHTAPQLKYVISKCSFFVGARTHATIAAYSTGVPTLVVGYSVKARGIARDLFGTEEGYVLPVQQLKESDELTRAFIKLYEKRENIQTHLKTILPAYIARADDARSALEELIKK
jgi:colanic acid/amylovoran biosynthesis protein